MSKYTPTPWRVGETASGDIAIFGAGLSTSLAVIGSMTTYLKPEVRQADAALIVRAVNAHEPMLAALRLIIINWEEPSKQIATPAEIQRIRTAIAIAEGQQTPQE
jgi:hypothetical protein